MRARLLEHLMPQITDDVEVKVMFSDPLHTLGENRQIMIENAQGEYVNFIDDDDMVPSDYVAKIYPLLNGVDYVGFPVKVFRGGLFWQMSYHSLKHRDWKTWGDTAFRDISHLNPMKRTLAIQGNMEGNHGEDGRWAKRLRELGIVKTENYIPEPMYFYYSRPNI